MRDPLGSIRVGATQVERKLHLTLPSDHFLHHQKAGALVEAGQLVGYRFHSATDIVSPKIGFVTYPFEWCNAQFIAAADLTLALSEAVLPDGYELKDASAWNVLFDGCRPVFCDHLSFQKIADRRWWAFAQFIRHFILPLCLARYRGLSAAGSMTLGRDGVDPDLARTLMGGKRFFTRYWMLLLKPRGAAPVRVGAPGRSGDTNHRNLYAMTRWLLDGVRYLGRRKSTWVNYTGERQHYTGQAADTKYQSVSAWLSALAPAWVVDLGCNTGEYAKLAAAGGAQVVAIDLDHESIQALYLSNKGERIYPVLANFDDLSGGRGWCGTEFPGLIARLEQQAEVVLMLAVLHHLAISSAIPFALVARMAARMTKRYLIIELIDAADPLVLQLAAQRSRSADEFSIDLQRAAFDLYFRVVETIELPGATRQLLLMEKR